MHCTQFLLLIVSVIGTAHSQSWAGTYTAGSSCNTTVCCCLSGQIVLTNSLTNNYTVNSSLSGACGNTTSFSGIAYTSAYTGWMVVNGSNDTLTLTSDSRTIMVGNPTNSPCNGKGVKSGAIKEHVNILILFALFLITASRM